MTIIFEKVFTNLNVLTVLEEMHLGFLLKLIEPNLQQNFH